MKKPIELLETHIRHCTDIIESPNEKMGNHKDLLYSGLTYREYLAVEKKECEKALQILLKQK